MITCTNIFNVIFIVYGCSMSFSVADCLNGTYGSGCTNQCGKCHNSEPCDKVTGNCSSGCEEWYIPKGKCNIEIGKADVAKNIISPRLNKAFDTSIYIAVRGFRHENPELGMNYLLIAEYSVMPLSEHTYQATDVRVYEAETGEYGKEVMIFNLEPDTMYSMRTAVYRVWGELQDFIVYSSPLTQKTYCSKPRVSKLEIQVLSEEQILVSWKNTTSGCGSPHLKSAELLYGEATGNGSLTHSKFIDGLVYSMTLDIKKNTKYYLKVRVTNNNIDPLSADSPVLLYDPANYLKPKDAKHRGLPAYVYGLIGVIGILLSALVVGIFSFFYKSRMTYRNGYEDILSHEDSFNGYLPNLPASEVSSNHTYQTVL